MKRQCGDLAADITAASRDSLPLWKAFSFFSPAIALTIMIFH